LKKYTASFLEGECQLSFMGVPGLSPEHSEETNFSICFPFFPQNLGVLPVRKTFLCPLKSRHSVIFIRVKWMGIQPSWLIGRDLSYHPTASRGFLSHTEAFNRVSLLVPPSLAFAYNAFSFSSFFSPFLPPSFSPPPLSFFFVFLFCFSRQGFSV